PTPTTSLIYSSTICRGDRSGAQRCGRATSLTRHSPETRTGSTMEWCYRARAYSTQMTFAFLFGLPMEDGRMCETRAEKLARILAYEAATQLCVELAGPSARK